MLYFCQSNNVLVEYFLAFCFLESIFWAFNHLQSIFWVIQKYTTLLIPVFGFFKSTPSPLGSDPNGRKTQIYKCTCVYLTVKMENHLAYVNITLTSYPHPRLTPGPLIFSVKIPTLGTAFQYKTPAPGPKKRNKIPTSGHNLPGSNVKISMKSKPSSLILS